METAQKIAISKNSFRILSLDKLFDVAKKPTVIRLRWPLVILCSYLLLYSPGSWLGPSQIQAVLIFYLLSNVTLYLVSEERFDSPYFYGPLLFFDTFFLAVCLALSGGASTDLYIACFLTLVLSCLCDDARGLLVVTLLSPVLYGYVVLSSAAADDPSLYLKLPFPFVISIFYGYFAQVERLKKTVKERDRQIEREQRAAEEIRLQRGRLQILHEINLGVTSTLDSNAVLDTLLDKALAVLPYDAASVQLLDQESRRLQAVAAKKIPAGELDGPGAPLAFGEQVVESGAPLAVHDALTDPRGGDPAFFRVHGLASYLGIPLAARGKILGALAFYTRRERVFSDEEVRFLATLGGQVAIAVCNSQLFEQTKRQAEELKDAGRIKDEFLGVVSHELKTPLNVISGYTNMLTERMLGEISPIQEKALQTVLRQSKELQGMINCILQVSSIEAQMLRADIHEVNTWDFLYEIKSYYDFPLEKDVKLEWDFPFDLPVVDTDRSKLKHILQNLVNNAIKFTERGTVTVSARYIEGKKKMEFQVADTGIGMPKKLLSTIFERFRQLDSSQTRAHGGVGLGLYIVKKYADLLGGTIRVESVPRQGSTFTLAIPCRPRRGAGVEFERVAAQ